MSPEVLGEYDFTNHYLINTNSEREQSAQTIVHEIFHMICTLQSSYGNFLQLHKRITVIDMRFKYINEYLLAHTQKMQEAISIFSEIILLINSKSYKDAMAYKNNLRRENEEYYKYVSPLLPVLDFIEENDERSKSLVRVPAREMFNIILELARYALNIDLTQINIDIFRSEKELKAFSRLNDTAKNFFPNKKFENIIKEFIFLLNQANGSVSPQKMIEDFVLNIKVDITENSMNTIINRNKKHIMDLYWDSPDINAIIETLNKATAKSIDAIDLAGSGIPETGNAQYAIESKTNISEIISISANHVGILFILSDLNSFISESSRYYFCSKDNRKIDINFYMISFLDFTEKKQFMLSCEEKSISGLCNLVKSPIVVNYKMYDKVQYLVDAIKCQLFIYCDRSYVNSIEIIKKYTGTCKQCAFISYGDKIADLCVLVIQLDKYSYFLLPILELSRIALLRDIEAKNINLTLKLEITQDLLYQIDTIINCLFYY